MDSKINNIVLELTDKIIEQYNKFNNNNNNNEKYIVSLSGPPGVGKSTISEQLVKELNKRLSTNNGNEDQLAIIVPMDGYHLDNNILIKRNLLHVKGSPPTFDCAGFLNILERLKTQNTHNDNSDIYIPTFDRSLDKSIGSSSVITFKNRLLIVEGNYLLLNEKIWCKLKDLFDYSIFIKANMQDLEQRLINRWLNYSHDPESAKKRALSNDIPNAHLVINNSNLHNVLVIENNN